MDLKTKLQIIYMILMLFYGIYGLAVAVIAFANMSELKDKLNLVTDNLS